MTRTELKKLIRECLTEELSSGERLYKVMIAHNKGFENKWSFFFLVWAKSKEDANNIILQNKESILQHLDQRKYLGRRQVNSPVEKNVFFNKTTFQEVNPNKYEYFTNYRLLNRDGSWSRVKV